MSNEYKALREADRRAKELSLDKREEARRLEALRHKRRISVIEAMLSQAAKDTPEDFDIREKVHRQLLSEKIVKSLKDLGL